MRWLADDFVGYEEYALYSECIEGQTRWRRYQARVATWCNQDDPNRQQRCVDMARDLIEGRFDWPDAEHNQNNLFACGYDLWRDPIINAPERLEWWIEKYVGTDPSIGELREARAYALKIWRSIPGLPDVPDRRENDLQSWRESLLIWCVKADRVMNPAPAKLPDPTHADKPPKRKAGRPAVRTAAVKQADAKLWRDFQSSDYQTYLDYANARGMPLADVERRIEAARRDASRAQKSAPTNPVKRK